MKCSCGSNMVWLRTQSSLNKVTVYYSCPSCDKVRQDMYTWDIATWDCQQSHNTCNESATNSQSTQEDKSE